jgi:hypothetical protein
LQLGNNNQPDAPPNASLLPGKTRMTDQQITEFSQRYQIVDHHADDATGFSATLLFDTQTNSYTLSFRSVEYALRANGGDYEHDGGPGASGEVGRDGFAFAQLVSMERYYRELKADPARLPAGSALNVTGYSLGGHFATVANRGQVLYLVSIGVLISAQDKEAAAESFAVLPFPISSSHALNTS